MQIQETIRLLSNEDPTNFLSSQDSQLIKNTLAHPNISKESKEFRLLETFNVIDGLFTQESADLFTEVVNQRPDIIKICEACYQLIKFAKLNYDHFYSSVDQRYFVLLRTFLLQTLSKLYDYIFNSFKNDIKDNYDPILDLTMEYINVNVLLNPKQMPSLKCSTYLFYMIYVTNINSDALNRLTQVYNQFKSQFMSKDHYEWLIDIECKTKMRFMPIFAEKASQFNCIINFFNDILRQQTSHYYLLDVQWNYYLKIIRLQGHEQQITQIQTQVYNIIEDEQSELQNYINLDLQFFDFYQMLRLEVMRNKEQQQFLEHWLMRLDYWVFYNKNNISLQLRIANLISQDKLDQQFIRLFLQTMETFVQVLKSDNQLVPKDIKEQQANFQQLCLFGLQNLQCKPDIIKYLIEYLNIPQQIDLTPFQIKLLEIKQEEINKVYVDYLKNINNDIYFKKINKHILNYLIKNHTNIYYIALGQLVKSSCLSDLSIIKFIDLVFDMVYYNLEQQNSDQALLFMKILTLASMDKFDQFRRVNMQYKNDLLPILLEKIITYDSYLYDLNREGTPLLDYVIKRQHEIQSKLTTLFNRVEVGLIAQKIFHEVMYFLYLLYWNLPNRGNLQIIQVQNEGLQLFKEIYRFTMCLFCDLSKNIDVTQRVYDFINPCLIVACGQKYHEQIYPITQQNSFEEMKISLDSIRELRILNITIVYNKYFELAYALLFESCIDQINQLDKSKSLMLKFLEDIIEQKIELIQRFKEILPKFMFYIRIERNQDHIDVMKRIITKILPLSQDNSNLKILFEALSVHSSILLKLDVAEQNEDLEKAYQMANIPIYAIPIYSEQQQLIKYVDNKESYNYVVLNVLEIIFDTLKMIKQNNQFKRIYDQRSLHFQGDGSQIQIQNLQLDNSFILTLKFKYVQQQVDEQDIVDLLEFVQNYEQTHIITLNGLVDQLVINLGRNKSEQCIFIRTKLGHVQNVYQELLPIELQNQWVQLTIFNHNGQILVVINEHNISNKMNQDLIPKHKLFDFKELTIVFGSDEVEQKKEDFDSQRSLSFSQSFLNLQLQKESFFFTGQLSELQIYQYDDKITQVILSEQYQELRKYRELLLLELDLNSDTKINTFALKEYFINSQFSLEINEAQLFRYKKRITKKAIFKRQNIYLIDINSFKDLIVKNGNLILFYMIIDLFNIIEMSKKYNQIYDKIVVKILNIISTLLEFDGQTIQDLFKSSAQAFFYIISKYINRVEKVSDEFFESFMEIIKITKESTLTFQLLKLTLNQYLEFEQITQIFELITKSIGQNLKELLDTARNINNYQHRDGISHISMLIGNCVLSEFEIRIKGTAGFISHSYESDLRSQIEFDLVKQPSNTNSIDEVFNFMTTVYLNEPNLQFLDILQIISLVFEIIEEKRVTKFKRTKQDLEKIFKLFSNGAIFCRMFSDQYKYIDRYFELMFNIMVLISRNLGIKMDFQGFIQIMMKHQLSSGIVMISDKMMQCITKYFDIFYSEQQRESLLCLLSLVHNIYQIQICDEQSKQIMINYFNDQTKGFLRKNLRKWEFLDLLCTFEKVGQMLDYMIPVQINEKQNSKTKIYELYADILTYMFENKDVAIFAYIKNQEPNLSDFPITTNKTTFQIYLQILQGYATLLKTEFDGHSGGQAYFNDRLKDKEILIKFINLINFTLHLDQLILQEKFDHIRWDYFANVLEKIIDLFYSMGLLFSTIEPIPCIKGVPQIWVCKNESGRLIPNGGIARLMLSLILSTMTYFDIVPIFEKYMDYFKHFLLRRLKEKETNQSYHNPYPQLFQNFTSLMQNIDFRLQSVGIQKNGQNDEQLKDLFIHKILGIIVYRLLSLKSHPEDYSNIIQKFIAIMERKIPNIFEKLNQNVINNYHLSTSYIDKQQLDPIKDVGQILECFKTAQEHEKGKKPKIDPKLKADIKAVLLGQSFDYDWILKIMYQFFYLPYDLIERLWIMSANEKIQRQSMSIGSGSDHQLSLFTNNRGESRTFSLQSIQENRKYARSSDEENWQQVSVEVKMKNSLWYFLDEGLQPLYQMLDNFLVTRQFDFVIMGQIQNKFMIRPLEDSIRRRQQLTPIKLINKNKPYQIPQQSKVDFSLKKINDSCQPSNQSPTLLCQSESLSSSLNFGSSRKESTLSRTNQVISTQKLSFRKDSSESQMETDNTKCYDCFVVMPDGGIFGSICVKQDSIQFQSKTMGNIDNIFKCPEVNFPETQFTLMIKFKDITQIQSRRYLLQEIAFEIFSQYSNYFFNLMDNQKVRQFLTSCQQKNVKVIIDRKHEFINQKFVQKWQAGQISNFHYLMLLNTYSGRSYNDIGQYFIFPWVIIDFKAINFDPQNNNVRQFRSLNCPIGTIEPSRIATTQQRFEQRDRNNLDEYVQHGSHYSNSTIVMNYLIRLEPFNELHYKLQRNRFDIADRLFSSIQLLWENTKWQDCKELIPEFYHMPEFLQNINCFDFGRMQSNIQVADVDMPQWVRTRTAEEFVYLMRAALECDYVSLNLNEWIDLTFGEKQYGKKAEDSFNLYHHLSYEQNFNLKQLKSTQNDEIQSRIAQIQYFGQTPSQMFDKQHEKRKKNKYMYVRRKPVIKYKHCVYYDQKNSQKAKEIIGLYFYQEKKVYLLTNEFELQSIELKETLKYICCTNGRFQISKILKKFNNIQTQFNSHNLFSFIQQSADHFFDNIDSQYHVNLNDTQETDLYFVIGGFLEGEFEFYNLTQQKCGQKVTHHKKYITCLKYHAYQKLLVVGSIDSIVSVWRLKFKNKEMENLKDPEFQIMAHKNSITCVDIQDIYILSVDLNQTAYLHTISGETIHQIQLSTESYISQCIIHPAQFLIFKTKKTVLNVYTFNASCYINNYDLNMENTYNMYFFTPFSTIFFIASEDSDQIIVQDIFEIKHNQQNYRPMDTVRSSVSINQLKPEKSERVQQDVMREPVLNDNHVSCFCICFNDYKLEQSVNYQFYYQIFCSTNGQIYWLQDENQRKEPIFQYEFVNMGLGSKFQI